MTFSTALIKIILESLGNNFNDNYNEFRYGPQIEKIRKEPYWKKLIRKKLRQKHFVYCTPLDIISAVSCFDKHICKFEYLYNILNDEKSKDLLIKILAYRLLGHKKIKLPTNNSDYWRSLSHIDSIANKEDFVEKEFSENWKLYRFNLNQIDLPFDLYYTSGGVYIEFILKQYEYHSDDFTIKVQKGDVVIDAGGCWGDTALYFANEVGSSGKIYSFEFMPNNLAIMERNLSLNPKLNNTIVIIKSPLWDKSDINVYYTDNGPGSSVVIDKEDGSTGKAITISIDDFVVRNDIEKVDFIKMDIENAEIFALKGAEKTIKRFKPKLAIALYHKVDDFYDIPNFINSLNLGYKFYLGHYTIHAEETILFAKCI